MPASSPDLIGGLADARAVAMERRGVLEQIAAPPPRSLDQRLAALERANRVRSARAALKRDLKAGRVALEQLLEDPPDWLLTARIGELLLAVPKLGSVKVRRRLALCAIAPSRTLGGLTVRQRRELLEARAAPNLRKGPQTVSRETGELGETSIESLLA